ncbi:O-antigen flippase, partial [Shewanella sp. Isolate7]|nr:O-antigen flippase [Shewanella sp. Isolate7]
MNLIKTSLLSGVSVFVKVLTLLGVNKVLAIYVGPHGYAAIGQLQNIIQIITGVATGTLSNGVTKLTAENEDAYDEQIRVWKTAGFVTFLFSIVISI